LASLLATPAHMDAIVSTEMKDAFASLLEASFRKALLPGTLAMGEVIAIDKDGLTVDVAGKYEGVVPIKEIPGCYSADDLHNEYQVGQCLEFFMLKDHEEKSHYVLSVKRVLAVKSWQDIALFKDSGETLEAVIQGPTKGGMLATILGIKGFIPASQLRVTKNLDELPGDTLPVKVLEVDRNRNKLILSHRQAVFEQKSAQRAETLKQLQEGDIVNGEVVKVTDFGVFVDINGIDGLLPLSEITWRRIHHPSDVMTLGQQVTVTVLSIDLDRKRISLSLKRMEADPWTTVDDCFTIGDTVDGRISKQLASGVLVELIPGVEAFCSYGQHGRIFDLDAVYRFQVMSIASADRRLTLGYLGEMVSPAPAAPTTDTITGDVAE
jgi:small subunit ribosomal protein S1